MEIFTLSIERRQDSGSANSRRHRRAGRLPGVLYGLDRPTFALTMDEHAFHLAFERGRRVFDLQIANEDKRRIALLKDVQYNAIGDRILHVDFMRVDESKPTTVNVPLHFEGQPQPVAGATLEVIRKEVEVSCTPRAMPSGIEVALGGLAVGNTIVAKEIELPEGVELVTPEDTVLVTYHVLHGKAEETEGEGEDGETPTGEE